MLQIFIVHDVDSIKIQKVVNLQTLEVITEFDNNTGNTDITMLNKYVGEKVMVSHYNKQKDGSLELDYEHTKTLTVVDKDKDGIWFIQYE